MPKEDYKECQGEAGRESASSWAEVLVCRLTVNSVAAQSSLKPPGL